MTPYERASFEAARRVEVLPAEMASWIAASTANIDGLGIHRSQLFALRDLMDTLVARQRTMLAVRPNAEPLAAYADAELAFTAEIVGAYELWTAFRSVLDQRRDEQLAPLLDAADLVAASAYRRAMDQAAAWGVVRTNEYREPPLVCAEAIGSPGTAARGQDVAGLAGTIRRYRGRLLPIPMILFPADRLEDIWSFCAIVHEVGHDLDADLAISAEAIDHGIEQLVAAAVPDDRCRVWRTWGQEVMADAVGVILGGVGFAAHLGAWLLPIALAGIFDAPNGDPHPPPAIRIRALRALVSAAGVASWEAVATELDASVMDLEVPDWQRPYESDAAIFSDAVLTTPLTALAGHAIRDLVPDLAGEAILVERIAAYIRYGINRTPTPAGPPVFPTRLVPSAAALALQLDPAQKDLAGIAARALDYIADIPRQEFLAGPVAGRREYLNRLAEELDVRPIVDGKKT